MAVAERMPEPATVTWGIPSPQGRRSAVLISRDDIGYPGGDIDEAAEWVNAVVVAWLQVLREHPLHDLEARLLEIHGSAIAVDDNDDE